MTVLKTTDILFDVYDKQVIQNYHRNPKKQVGVRIGVTHNRKILRRLILNNLSSILKY